MKRMAMSNQGSPLQRSRPYRHMARLVHLILMIAALSILPLKILAIDLIVEDYGGLTYQERDVVDHKIALWEEQLPNWYEDGDYQFHLFFDKADLGGSSNSASLQPAAERLWTSEEGIPLCEAEAGEEPNDHRPNSALILFNNNQALNDRWYKDIQEPVPQGKYDFFTVVNYAIAAAVGFSDQYTRFSRNCPSPGPWLPRVYNSDGHPNAQITPYETGAHTDEYFHPNDLMNKSLPAGRRYHPSRLDGNILRHDVWAFPPFGRDSERWGQWNFPESNPGGPDPDYGINSGGQSLQVIGQATHHEAFNGRRGVWQLNPDGQGMWFTEANTVAGHGLKEVWVQVTYNSEFFEPKIAVEAGFTRTYKGSVTLDANNWKQHLTKWEYLVEGCPESEKIEIWPDLHPLYVDQVIIDSICYPDQDEDRVSARDDCDDNDNTVYPGAPEKCDDKDNDCDGSVDEDFMTPGPTGGLKFLNKNKNTMTWPAEPVADSYDAIKGDLDALRSTKGDFSTTVSVCLDNDGIDTQATDTEVPSGAGQGFYYLIRGQHDCKEGTYNTETPKQVGDRDLEIESDPDHCP